MKMVEKEYDGNSTDAYRTTAGTFDFILHMSIDLKVTLLLAIIASILILIPGIIDNNVKQSFEIIYILLIPGYSIVAIVYSKKNTLTTTEWFLLSFGVSSISAVIICLLLVSTSVAVKLDYIALCLSLLTAIMVFIASAMRFSFLSEDRFTFDIAVVYNNIKKNLFKSSGRKTEKAITVIFILLILVALSTIFFWIAVPPQGESFTEFYILGPDGKADGYPTDFIVGEQKPVIVGVVNHEHKNTSYVLSVVLNDSVTLSEIYAETLTLADNQTWEKTIMLSPDRTVDRSKIELLLYLGNNMTSSYRKCYFWTNVTNPSNPSIP